MATIKYLESDGAYRASCRNALGLSITLQVDPFIDIIGRHFKQPAEGLGRDNTPSSYMWRTIINPTRPL